MSNYYSKLFSQAPAKYGESIFDKVGSELIFKPAKNSKINTDELFDSPPLTCNLTCKNLCSNEIIEGTYSLHKNFLIFFGAEDSNSFTSVLDFSNSKFSSVTALSKFKIILRKDKFSYELVFSDKKVWELWTPHFQKYCILTNFDEKYQTLETLENGKHSKVITIRSQIGGFYYSAKVYDKEELLDSKNPIPQVSLINQIETMRCLDHNKIIKLIEIHETPDFIYLVTECTHSQTLEKMLRNSKPSAGTAKTIIFSILRALTYMASKEIIHRNIKPSNILLDGRRTVKITGFSLATFVNAPKINFATCGTPGYIAPEILTYEEESSPYDDKCDIFSAGCIFFNLLFGHPLFQGSNASEIVASNKIIIDSDIDEILSRETNLDISKPETHLLLKLLERDPNKRISAREALSHPYFQRSPVKSQIKLTSKDLTNILDEPSPKHSPRKSSFGSPRSAEGRSPLFPGDDQQSRVPTLSFTSAIKKSVPETQRSSQLLLSPRNNQVLKAAIFCNLKNQIKNESAEEIKLPFVVMPLKKKSLSESKLLVSTKFSSSKNANQNPPVDEESEVVCDEGSNVCFEFEKWSGNFITNSPSTKIKRI